MEMKKVKDYIIKNEEELMKAGFYLGGFLVGGFVFNSIGRIEANVYKQENNALRVISLALAHSVGEKEAVINHLTKNINNNINTNK